MFFPQKVEEMMRYFVELGLFENCQGTITCLKLAKRLDKSMTSNPEMRAIIDRFKSHDQVMIESGRVMQDKIRLDKNRSDNKEAKKTSRFKKPTHEDLIEYFKQYCQEKKLNVQYGEHERFYDFYESKNWYVGKNKMKDWKAAARNWLNKSKSSNYNQQPSQSRPSVKEFKI